MKHIPDASLNQHLAILGKTGSGKTFTAKGIVEHLLDKGRQVCALDPTGAWWGLRLGADGKSAGYDVVLLGGAHADIPLAERSGAAVARLVTEQGASVVIDTSGFTVGEYTRWFIDFAGTLYTTIREPLHLVIDEAHYFMPQGKSPDVDAGRMLHAGNRLMSGGRSKGIRGILITQRPAKLHKDALTCADTLIAMRVIAPQDRQAVKDWIDGAGDAAMGKTVLDSLASLARGEGWVWYPEGGHLERVQFPAIKTYDSSATPKHGAKAGPKVREIRLDEVKASLAEAVKEAEANDPKLLRKRIAELEAQGKRGKAVPTEVNPRLIDAVRDKATREAQAGMKKAWAPILREFSATVARLKGEGHSLLKTGQVMVDAAGSLQTSLSAAATILEAPLATNGHDPVRRPEAVGLGGDGAARAKRPVERHAPQSTGSPGDLAGLQPAERRVIEAICLCKAMGTSTPSREQVAFWCACSPTSGSFMNRLGGMRSAGHISYPSAGLVDTRHDIGTDSDAALERAKESLAPAERSVLAALAGSGALTREDLAEAVECSPTSGSFMNRLGALRTAGLIVYPAQGSVELAEWLKAHAGALT